MINVSAKKALSRLKSKNRDDIFTAKVARLVQKTPIVNKMFERVCTRLFITTKPGEDVRLKTARIFMVYPITVLLVILATSSYASVWYLHALNFVIGIIIPYVLTNMYINFTINKAVKQLPQAMDELEAAYFKSNRLTKAIEISLDYMPRDIAAGFRVLYFNMLKDQEKAIQEFKEAYRHPYIDILTSLFSIYIRKGGDIGNQLQYLNNLIQSDLVIKNYNKSSLVKYKVLAAATVFIVPLMIILNSKLNTNVELFFKTTLEGSTSIAIAIAGAIAYFVFIELLERI